MYVRTYVRMYVYVCMYVRLYVCMYVRTYVFRIILKINIYYFPTQYLISFLRKLQALCSLRSIN
jgi:hypothetical protein